MHEHEFIRWGVDYYQRAAMGGEVLDIVKRAWTQDEVTYEGKYFRFDEALPQPKPYQQPHPPIWAAVHSDAAIEFAAKNNYDVAQNLDTDEVIARKFDLFRKTWRACNHPGPMPRVFLQRQVHVAETDAKAHEQAREYLDPRGRRGAGRRRADREDAHRLGHPCARHGARQRAAGRQEPRRDDAARTGELRVHDRYGLALVGSPDTIIRRLEEGKQRIGYDIFCTNHEIGKMPHEMVRKSIALFGKEVLPAFA